MPTLPNDPFTVLPRPPFPKTNVVIIYNSDPALGSGTSNWSYQVAQWYCNARGLTQHLYGIDFSKIYDGSASGYDPATATNPWNGGGNTSATVHTNLWATYGAPLTSFLNSVNAQAVLCSAGTPTLTLFPNFGAGFYSSTQAIFGMWLTWDHINTLAGSVQTPYLRANSDALIATGYTLDGQRWPAGARLIAPVSYDYRPDLQAPDQGGFQNPGLNNYNNFAGYDIANTTTSDGFPFGWGTRPHGRIGRPSFGFERIQNGGNVLPAETPEFAYAVVNQALRNQKQLSEVKNLGCHVGVCTYSANTLSSYDAATIYSLLRTNNFTKLYYYTRAPVTGNLATTLTPTGSESYSFANLTGAGVGPYPCWMACGYALQNTVWSDPGWTASWQIHPGAWGFNGTSFSWQQVARIQTGGGIGGLGSIWEPFASNAGGTTDYVIKVLQGMSLMEAGFYASTLYDTLSTTTFGDPLYTPVASRPNPEHPAPGPQKQSKKKEKKGPLYLAR